jgi:hypothetical protein
MSQIEINREMLLKSARRVVEMRYILNNLLFRAVNNGGVTYQAFVRVRTI